MDDLEWSPNTLSTLTPSTFSVHYITTINAKQIVSLSEDPQHKSTSLSLTNAIDDSEEKNRGNHEVSSLHVRKRLRIKYNTVDKQHKKVSQKQCVQTAVTM